MTTLAAWEADHPTYQCLKNFLKLNFTMDMLQALKNLLVAMRTMVVTYLSYLLLDNVDAALEQYIMGLKLDAIEQTLGQVQQALYAFQNIMPPAPTSAECTGVSDAMGKIYSGMDKVMQPLQLVLHYSTRYQVAGLVEGFVHQSLQETIDYIDVFIAYIDAAITEKATP